MVDVEKAIKLLTPKAESAFIGLDAKSALAVKDLFIQMHLKAEGEIEWQPTFAGLKKLMQRLAPGVHINGDPLALASAIHRVVEAAFMGGPEVKAADVARLRYQLRYVRKHGHLDLSDESSDADKTDPGL